MDRQQLLALAGKLCGRRTLIHEPLWSAPASPTLGAMDTRVTFIGSFRIPDYDAWLPAMQGMTRFVAERVPGVLSFDAYVDEGRSRGTVVYVHPDADSLDEHLSAAADQIRAGSAMVEVTAIRILGTPHQATVDRLRASGARVEVGRLPEVAGDETQLRQLFQNLISNALKFRRPDSPPPITIGGCGRWIGSGTLIVSARW